MVVMWGDWRSLRRHRLYDVEAAVSVVVAEDEVPLHLQHILHPRCSCLEMMKTVYIIF